MDVAIPPALHSDQVKKTKKKRRRRKKRGRKRANSAGDDANEQRSPTAATAPSVDDDALISPRAPEEYELARRDSWERWHAAHDHDGEEEEEQEGGQDHGTRLRQRSRSLDEQQAQELLQRGADSPSDLVNIKLAELHAKRARHALLVARVRAKEAERDAKLENISNCPHPVLVKVLQKRPTSSAPSSPRCNARRTRSRRCSTPSGPSGRRRWRASTPRWRPCRCRAKKPQQ